MFIIDLDEHYFVRGWLDKIKIDFINGFMWWEIIIITMVKYY